MCYALKYGVWNVSQPEPEAVNALVRGGYAPLAAMVLASRGLDTKEQADKYLDCNAPLLDPFLMTDMAKAAGRVGLAMAKGEKIAVFGDYDVDGITSTCLLTDFLRRLSPAMAAWVDDTGWSYEDGSILLTCPDAIAMRFFKSHQVDEKLKTAIYDIFRVTVPVSLTVCGERDAWTQKMRAERGFSFPTKAPADEPPLWDDSVLAQQDAEQAGSGGPAQAAAKAAAACS